MKLNEQSKNELRKEIVEAVKRVPEGQRIELPLDLLDDLIFLKIKDKEGITVKFPIWTGEFLRKIDLSKLSFENVFFVANFDDLDGDKFDSMFDENFSIYSISLLNNNDKINFSYTNANIDFSKIYINIIAGCNFEGLDFSNANCEIIDEIYGSNFLILI